jgi:predicted HNH restriction endonuclease
VTVNAYERNPEARRQCIAAYGAACCICGFLFGAVYGPEAEGYIHVHHLRPLSDIGGEYVVDPVEDLRPVCANCHAVLHLGGRCRSIDEVRQLLQ